MSKKISDFLAWGNQAIPDSGSVTFVYNGVNYKQTYQNFVNNLGVTGSIAQDGAPTGTPILDIQGTVNAIRNLEDGSGVKTSVSPENGAKIEHNFIQNATGVALVKDLAVAQPEFRSIVAGSGVNVSATNGTIQIALSATPATTKTVIVNEIGDFPAPSAGVITLDANTEYAVRNDITTTNRFILSNNTVINGSDDSVVALTYTGAGVMFTANAADCKIRDIKTVCTSGTLLDFNGSGTEVFQFLSSTVDCATFGTIDGVGGLYIDGCVISCSTSGVSFGGANGVALIDSISATMAAGTFADLNAATFDGFSITECFVTVNGSSVFVDGAAGSANINAGGLGSIHNCRISGAGTALQTITDNDVRWQFLINDEIVDTHKDCLMSLIGNVTETVITVASTPVKVAGTWTQEHASQFSTDSTGKMTYNGIKETHFDVTFSFTGGPVASTKNYAFYLAKNGTVIPNSVAADSSSSTVPGRTTLVWRIPLVAGDYLEAFVENRDDTVNMLITDAVMRVG